MEDVITKIFNEQIQKATEIFGLDYSNVKLEIINKNILSHGRASTKNKMLKIIINMHYCLAHRLDNLTNTIIHEIAHITQHLKGQKMSHKDWFHNYCVQMGGSWT